MGRGEGDWDTKFPISLHLLDLTEGQRGWLRSLPLFDTYKASDTGKKGVRNCTVPALVSRPRQSSEP